MDNFYDINDFIVFLFKKWKMIIIIMVLGAVLFSGNRAVSMIRSYTAQDENTDVVSSSDIDSEEPLWYKVQNIIEITPEQEDQTPEMIIEAYRKLSGSSTVLNGIYERWYESELEEYGKRVEKLHEYGYILDKEVNYPYALRDFNTQFLINNDDLNTATRTQATYEERFIAVGFKSTNETLAREIADDYTQELTAAVQKAVGEFSYEIVDQSLFYDLPAASSGTQTTRVLSSSSSPAVVTVNQIIIQCVKGVIWGAVIGAGVSIILAFLMYMMTRKIYLLSDVRKFNVSILGTGFLQERGFIKIRACFHTALEGGSWDDTGHKKLLKRIAETAGTSNTVKDIYVTGTCKTAYLKKIAQELNEISSSAEFHFVEGIQTSGKAAGIARQENTAFILLEKFGESVKDNIEYELEELNKLETNILGMIVLE